MKAVQLPSPIQELDLGFNTSAKFWIKRDDLIHPTVTGNKWRKLKSNLLYVKDNNLDGILSFGGAFSNHLYAVAAACNLEGLESIGIVRTEKLDMENPTIQFLLDQGMKLLNISRDLYSKKDSEEYLSTIRAKYPSYHIVPEGGSNELAIHGVKEMMGECYQANIKGKNLFVAGVGTGTTLVGIVQGLALESRALGIAAVKDASLLKTIQTKLTEEQISKYTLDFEGARGGFAKFDDNLISFINEFYTTHRIKLDPIYNAKVLMRVKELSEMEYFEEYDNVIIIHTGGVQGLSAFNYRYPGKLDAGLLSS